MVSYFLWRLLVPVDLPTHEGKSDYRPAGNVLLFPIKDHMEELLLCFGCNRSIGGKTTINGLCVKS